MHQEELLERKIHILLLAIKQFRNTDKTTDLINIIEKELNSMLNILDG